MPLWHRAAIGRGFTAAEDDDNVPRVVVLGNGLWRRRFGASVGDRPAS